MMLLLCAELLPYGRIVNQPLVLLRENINRILHEKKEILIPASNSIESMSPYKKSSVAYELFSKYLSCLESLEALSTMSIAVSFGIDLSMFGKTVIPL